MSQAQQYRGPARRFTNCKSGAAWGQGVQHAKARARRNLTSVTSLLPGRPPQFCVRRLPSPHAIHLLAGAASTCRSNSASSAALMKSEM